MQITLIHADSNIYVSDIYAFNADTVLFASRPYVYRTLNGGITWDSSLIGANLTQLDFNNNGTGYAISNSSTADKIWRSTDFGNSWDTIAIPFSYHKDIEALDGNKVILTFWPGYVAISDDAGVSWDSLPQFMAGASSMELNSISFINPQYGFICGTSNATIYTADSGNTWSIQSFGSTFHISQASFATHLIGWAVDDWPHVNEHLAFTNDGGISWYLPVVPPNPINLLNDKFQGVDFSGNGTGLTCSKFSLYGSSDFGNTWKNVPLNNMLPLLKVKVINDSIAYLGAIGGIYKITNFLSTGIQTSESSNLVKIFPSFFTESITIEFSDLFENSERQVCIVDLKGQLISQRTVNSKSNRINLINLPDGIYILRIDADDVNLSTKIVKVN